MVYLADIADDLYGKVSENIERLVKEQLGDKFEDAEPYIRRVFYPDDPQAICDITYQGKTILQVRMRDDFLGMEFIMPNDKKPKEIQDV